MSSNHRRQHQQEQSNSRRVSDTQNNDTQAEHKDESGDGEDDTDHAASTGVDKGTNHSKGTASADVNQTKICQRGNTKISDKPQASDQHKVKDNNNCQALQQNKIGSEGQRLEKTDSTTAIQNVDAATVPSFCANLKTSIYDWDSPSSFTGTVKRRSGRRPHSVAAETAAVERSLGHANVKQNAASESSALSVKALATKRGSIYKVQHVVTDCSRKNIYDNSRNNNVISERNATTVVGGKLKPEAVNSRVNNKAATNYTSNMPKSHRQGKEKSAKLRHSKSLVAPDRNANNAATTSSPPPSPHSDFTTDHNPFTMSQHSQSSTPDNVPKSFAATSLPTSYNRNLCNASFTLANELQDDPNAVRDANYMELSFYDGRYTGAEPTQITELFRDFPVSYESTTVITNSQFAKCGLSAQGSPRPSPPYREPPPPTPPPISKMPTRDLRFLSIQSSTEPCVSLSAPATPSRGKVVLSKKERKELSKLNARLGVYDGSEHVGGSASAHSSPYKGRVFELKNCLARGLFASLSRGSQKSLTANNVAQDEATTSSNEVSPPPPAPPDASPPNSNTSNNNDADYTEKLKNLPVRQRKTNMSHMDNYCLFDPVDFINEKALRQRTHEQLGIMFESTTTHGLRDPLFSSRQNLNFSEEEIVPEVIYNEELPVEEDSTLVVEVTFDGACGGARTRSNFDHHNYFVIDPDDFEEEPIHDIGIPNPYTNEQLVHANLEALGDQTTIKTEEPILRECASLDQLLEVLDTGPSMSNSQESKDTNTTASTTTTTSTALVESSTSSNSASSSTSAPSSQTTLKRTKKRLTFLNLSPFRTHSSKHTSAAGSSDTANDKRGKRHAANTDNKANNAPLSAGSCSGMSACVSNNDQRAVSELVSSEHMLHLQHMLLNEKEHLRSRTVPIESNYVLFNPGPVPSRNVPYKIRKPRPLSSHSDADSGFLSPCSPDELSALKFNSAILVLQQCDSVQGYIEIYTDWANYYLERAKSKKKVTDLSADCRDGLLLADVIEAVTSFKVPDLVKKPKNQQQMYDNVNSCLNVLRSQAVCGLDNITTNDICAGRLKAVLALFFALSRYKQQSKQLSTTTPNANVVLGTTNPTAIGTTTATSTTNSQATSASNQQEIQQQQHLQNGNETMLNRQIPSAYSKTNGGTAIPLPATVMVQRRCPPDKVRPLPPTPNHTPSIPGLGKSGVEFNSGRPNSPPTSNHTIQSLKTGNNNGLRTPATKPSHPSGIPPPSGISSVASVASAHPQQKHSMLDKLKLFNKEKQQQQNAVNAASSKIQAQSKRTSSSSGFSSARSERSDSSLSLNDGHISQIKPPTVSVTSGKGKVNTKQSKLLAAQLKKEQNKACKLDKKEKSPARSLNREDLSGESSKNSTMSRTKNSLPRVSEKNSSKSSSKGSLNSKSDSKSSLIVPPSKGLCSPNGSNTGLPKPIAAIKGTSKLPHQPLGVSNGDNRVRGMSNSNSQHEMMKREKIDISNMHTNISGETKSKNSQPQHQPHIVKPVPMLPELGSKPPYYANTANISPQHQQQLQLQQQRQQQFQQQQQAYYNQQQQQQHIDHATYINNSRLPPPKSASSPTTNTPSRKLEYNAGPGILSSPQRSPLRGHAQPPDSTSTHHHLHLNSKFHTIPSRIDTIYEEKKPTSLLPMPPLLRGYNSHVTLPTRGLRGGGAHNYVADFVEAEISQGYCSDGDSLRVSASARLAQRAAATARRFHEIDNGYLSEGSGSVGHHGMVIAAGMSAAAHTKHFLSMMRARTQLPTTIEERIRNSRGSLDSIGTAPPSSAASQASSSGGSNPKMDSTSGGGGIGGGGGSGNTSANASPQHHTHQHSQHAHHSSVVVGVHRSNSRSGRDNWTKMPEPLNGHNKGDKSEKSSPSRRSMGGGSGSSSKQGSPSGRTKGVPPSFGYVKRANGSATATAEQQNIAMMGATMLGAGGQANGGCSPGVMCGGIGRTAHVSAVPRTASSAGGGRKVSGGTQTLPNDMSKNPPSAQHRSFSLTGPGAAQLSQSIRERLATGSHSLPKPGSDLHLFQHRITNRPGKMIDGSLSDTQTYAEVKPEYSTYAMWLKHSNTAGSRLSEGDSLENMQIGSPAMARHSHKMLQHRNAAAAVAAAAAAAAATSAVPQSGGIAAVGVAGSESPYVQSPRLNRSNSIRSTKSEKMYPSMLSRGPDVEIEPYYCLPVGAIAAQNGSLSAQMAAVAAAAMSQVAGQPTVGTTAAPVAWSQPTSPTPISRGFGGTLSPTHPAGLPGLVGLVGAPGSANTNTTTHRLTYPKKNDEVHGSAASLLSGGSSLYGSAEERQANEIRRLKRELLDAREQVLSLSSQLSTNAHVVAAFEQSLSNMTSRLQHLTATAERKDGELTDMRQTIELLRKQSIQAGLTSAHIQSMGAQTQQHEHQQLARTAITQQPVSNQNGASNGTASSTPSSTATGVMQRHHSSDSMCSLNSISSGCSAQDKKQKKKGWLRSSFTKAFSRNAKISKTSRHAGHHHVNAGNGSNSISSHAMHIGINAESGAVYNKANGHSHAEPVVGLAALATQPAPPLPTANTSPTKSSPAKTLMLIDNAKPIDAIDHDDHHAVEELKKQLREKDLVLTDIRLEALSSASQLESLKETVNKMRAEMMSLKHNNERLQKMVTSRSLAGSEVSLGNAISPTGSIGESRRYSLADGNARPPMELPKRLEEEVEEENIPPAPAPEPPPPPLSPTTHIDLTPPPPALDTMPSPAHIAAAAVEELPDVTDGKKIAIACYLGQPESFAKYCEEMLEVDEFYANGVDADGISERKTFPTASLNEFIVAYTYISGKTTWQNLDYIVRKTFKDYAARIDPGTNLGLNTDSITSYHLGEAKRGPEMGFPELLPCGYIIGNVRTLYICLQGVGSLAFDSLIPRSIVHRYISLLTEHRRLILCGPSGTGKSYLARRLAEFLVARSGRGNPSEAIATFNVDHKSSKELRQYLGHIAEQAAIANGASELPSVIILDNLHHASALGDVFSCLLSAGPAGKLPCIIGTMSQATCNTTNLQLHHNFRWVLTANHMEPVKGFLGRFLRRRLFQLELQTGHPQPELATVLAWLPSVWQHINRFLEAHSSSDVTIGPRLFLACPLDLKDSQVWFTDIWNYHLSPYLVEAVREGVQLYGRRGGAWNDPSIFIRNSYPWPYGPDSVPPLRQINAEDVGLEGVAVSNGDNPDPLLNMLMRLQEAANYSENQDQESDCASLDSNVTPDSSAGAE